MASDIAENGYNRQQIKHGEQFGGLDIDNFKAINDTLGHAVGD